MEAAVRGWICFLMVLVLILLFIQYVTRLYHSSLLMQDIYVQQIKTLVERRKLNLFR
jgi:hypothetical protein